VQPLQEWRFTNLLELLRMYAELYCQLEAHLATVAVQTTIVDATSTDKIIGTLIVRLQEMKIECEKIQLTATADSIDTLLDRWRRYSDKNLLREHCAGTSNCLHSELKRRVCFIMPKTSQDLYASPLKGWEPVAEMFPEAKDDIEEVSFCLAFGRHGGAVFHVLLVVEFGIIRLGKFLGVTDPKLGWDATCHTLDKILVDGRNKCPRRLKKHFAFLELVNKDIQSMKLAWRNKVNHAAANSWS
jgi:hypothetical protein